MQRREEEAGMDQLCNQKERLDALFVLKITNSFPLLLFKDRLKEAY